jgi:two-component system, chemotaxis family, protein-glutamate methylesterase/glutaminase
VQSDAPQGKIQVLVVDDSAFVRRAIVSMFEHSPDIEVAGVASDGEAAIELSKTLRPDVVLLDVQMPVLDGLSALKRIMQECPTPVVMFSSHTGRGGEKTLTALDIGAVDFVDKSSAGGAMDIGLLARELGAKIRVAARVDVKKRGVKSPQKAVPASPAPITMRCNTEVVLIGTSTGGPPALQAVLSQIQVDAPCPILIVQHMPPGFTASLAKRLDRHSPLTVTEATDGEPILPGHAYLAPAGWHMRLRRQAGELRVWLDQAPDGHLHCPSVDALFDSAAAVSGSRCLAVVLTGMGKDGSVGALAIKKAGGLVVVEAEESAVVFGMPKAVIDVVGVDAVVPLHQVAQTIAKLF